MHFTSIYQKLCFTAGHEGGLFFSLIFYLNTLYDCLCHISKNATGVRYRQHQDGMDKSHSHVNGK